MIICFVIGICGACSEEMEKTVKDYKIVIAFFLRILYTIEDKMEN